MKIYVLLILNILNLLPVYSQDRLLSNQENSKTVFSNDQYLFSKLDDQAIDIQTHDVTSESVFSDNTLPAPYFDSIPWQKIDLGSPMMKKKTISKPFPWWIPLTIGGAALGTAAVLLILRDDEPVNPSGPIARNDQFTLPCKMTTSISPLNNDTGEGLRIVSVAGAPPGWVTFTDQTINVSEAATQDFSFVYTVMDSNGAMADATISVIFEFSPIQLQNQTFQGSPGDIITHQIFANAVCTECTITASTSTPQASFSWTPTGAFSFELPNVSQPQTFLFTFIVTDKCMQTGTAQISVTVRPDCGIEASFIVSNEECDFGDGSIEIVINPVNNYQFQWSNGKNTAIISGLSAGVYQVTITDTANPSCSEVFEIEVFSSIPTINLLDESYQTAANILVTGNVLSNDTGSGLQVSNFEDLDVLEFAIQPDGSFRFLADENAEDEYSSIYTVTDICGNTSTATVHFEVAKVPCDFIATITTTPADCGSSNGSASVIINPADAPYEIRWPNGTIGPAASGFSAGSYSLIITNTANNCVLTFNFVIAERAAPNYVQTLETSAATCIGGAQVDLVLSNPSGTSMQLIITRGNMPFLSLNVNNGLINLGEMANFVPGSYQISVNCSGCPAQCAQILNFTIAEVLPLLEVNDDLGSTPVNTAWNGNVLLNDSGAGMNVIGFTQPSAGVANINSNGLAVYNPPAGFTGTIFFNYTVRDTCGQEKSATVIINVVAIPCDFTAEFSNLPADCGQMNGSSTITISPSGNFYQVNWPDGTQGLTNNMLLPGTHTVTISNSSPGCELMFSTTITELPPANLIQELNGKPSTCLEDGSLMFILSNPNPDGIVVEIFLDNQFILSAFISALGTYSGEIDSLPQGNYLLQALISGSPRRCSDVEAFEIGSTNLPMTLVDDNHTIPFGTVWVGNVLNNDVGTGLQVNGFTQSPFGTVVIMTNGFTTFLPNPGFTGTASFSYFARDTCNQEQTATVNITVLPSIGNLEQDFPKVLTSFEFFRQSNGLINASFANSIPEGISSSLIYTSGVFQNGFRYTLFHKQWLLRTEFSYAEIRASDRKNQMLNQNNYQSRVGVGWFHDFNGNRIIAESGFATVRSKSVFSNSLSSTINRQAFEAIYFKTEYQLKLKSGYCIFWEPQLLYFPPNKLWNGMLSSGIKLVIK